MSLQNLSDLSSVSITTEPTKLISTLNSSTTPLIGNATFTGTGEDVSAYSSVTVSISSDVSSAADGLKMQFSTDATNWDSSDVVTSTTGAHTLVVIAQYFRIVYINGTTLQTYFRLQVIYHASKNKALTTEIGAILTASTETQAVRPTNSYDLDAAREHIAGSEASFFFGQNNDLQNGVFEDVWAGGGDINWQTTAAKVKVASSDAADTSAGLGLQSVEIHGLSATGVDQSEVISLSGVTAVESSLVYIRINLMHNEEVGTYGGSHQGTIECRVTNATFGNGDLLASMTGREGSSGDSVQFGYGESQNGFTTVPLNKVMYLTRLEVVPRNNKKITVILYERDGALIVADPFLPRRILWSVDELADPVEKEFKSHIKIKPLTDLWFRAEGDGAVSGCSVWIDYFLVDEDINGQ